MTSETVWSDEKISTVEQAHNRRNDRVIGKNYAGVSYEKKTVYRTMKPASLMGSSFENSEVPSHFC